MTTLHDPAAARDEDEREVVTLVNHHREHADLPPLTSDPELAALARAHSRDMAERDFFDHTNPDGHDPGDRARRAGIDTYRAENIALGHDTARDVVAAWMDSDGHRANILNPDHRTVGIGTHHADAPESPWWTQDFGT